MLDAGQWNEAARMVGEVVVDKENHRVGKVQDVGQRADTMEPSWLIVKTSRFGRSRLVPLAAVQMYDHVVHVPYDKQQVLESPVPAVPVTVAPSEDERLVRYYARAVA